MEINKSFSVSVSTFSEKPVNVIIRANEVVDYYIKNDVNYTTVVSPTEPQFFYYSFKRNKNENQTVLIEIESNDENCLMASIQKSFVSLFPI